MADMDTRSKIRLEFLTFIEIHFGISERRGLDTNTIMHFYDKYLKSISFSYHVRIMVYSVLVQIPIK